MITAITIEYLKGQIKAADIIQIFDSWAGILTKDQYNEFGMKYVKSICDAINTAPITVRKGAFPLNDMENLNQNTMVWIGTWIHPMQFLFLVTLNSSGKFRSSCFIW